VVGTRTRPPGRCCGLTVRLRHRFRRRSTIPKHGDDITLASPQRADFFRFHIPRVSTASSYLSLIQFNSKSARPFVQKKAGEKSPALNHVGKKLPYADITLESLVEETLKYSGFLDSH